jgi:hypothetical protein
VVSNQKTNWSATLGNCYYERQSTQCGPTGMRSQVPPILPALVPEETQIVSLGFFVFVFVFCGTMV